ncbi:hypothetical protein CALCODRAFT_184901 [Calocera cornea HHB12733]|uniref:Uncharacterized protein n=1 Tax=Calocera cornea HHB12733 TaxID=1353952 RepID=A0A165CA18_9BASI|nr:hypothetical protein CALCODRAFT_184901 [Calocera cornea HHB12733]
MLFSRRRGAPHTACCSQGREGGCAAARQASTARGNPVLPTARAWRRDGGKALRTPSLYTWSEHQPPEPATREDDRAYEQARSSYPIPIIGTKERTEKGRVMIPIYLSPDHAERKVAGIFLVRTGGCWLRATDREAGRRLSVHWEDSAVLEYSK